MSDLKNKKCIPCEEGAEPMSSEEIASHIMHTDGWSVINNRRIEKIFLLSDFKSALKFINSVAEIAEQEGHHPDILLYGWNKVKLTLSTHAADGLTINDFILATKIDESNR